jgi:hypothetical protein
VLLSATGPLNVWFNQANPPTGSHPPDSLMLSAASSGVFVLDGGSVPPLVPGVNYYLGFQNPGVSDVTFVFQAVMGLPPPSAFGITLTNGLFQLRWTAPASYQFQVEWTTSLNPPVVWTINAAYITSATGTFTFLDPNPPVQMKYYRLIEYP